MLLQTQSRNRISRWPGEELVARRWPVMTDSRWLVPLFYCCWFRSQDLLSHSHKRNYLFVHLPMEHSGGSKALPHQVRLFTPYREPWRHRRTVLYSFMVARMLLPAVFAHSLSDVTVQLRVVWGRRMKVCEGALAKGGALER